MAVTLGAPARWGKAEDAILKRMWQAGTPTREIVEALNAAGFGATKNAVLSRAHRTGLGEHPASVARRESLVIRAKTAADIADFPAEHGCVWPMWPNAGPPPGEPMRFCGGKAEAGRPYCQTHRRMAWARKDEPVDARAADD